MNISIHNIKEVVRSKIVKNEYRDKTYYTMKIKFINSDFTECKKRYSDEILVGDTNIKTSITLFAKTKEELKIKVDNLI